MAEEKMNPMLERAVAHFATLEVESFEVPEWVDADNNPLTIYHRPFTMAERKKVHAQAQGNALEGLVYIVILKALKADGSQMFTVADKQGLMNRVDSRVITRVAQQLSGIQVSLEDAEKN